MKRFGSLVVVVLLAACSGDRTVAPEPSNVVTLTARGLTFEGPDHVPPGWTTIRFVNESTMTHFAVLERFPEGISIADQQREVAPVFQEGMNLLAAGDAEAAGKKFGELPEWFGKVVFDGGPGLTAPGMTSETTVNLDPGYYILECYVKTNGVYGMVHELRVEGDPTSEPAPAADLRIRISSANGIVVEGKPEPGPRTVAVHFDDQKLHENFVGHDVHLVRLPEGSSVEDVASWMDWSQPHGLETPSPALFLGGVEEMPAGSTGYLSVDLEPGSYAWISEVPDPEGKGMLKLFTVEGAS